MTILQLKYLVAISSSSSMREASGKLFVSQPALSTAIRDLEEELQIRIFERTNKGMKLTEEGNEFLSFAKQAVSQFELVESKYLKQPDGKEYYTVSLQHYVFALHAFANTILKRNTDTFSYLINETRTDEVITSVRDYRSEIGILAYSETNKKVINKLLREYALEFHSLITCDAYVYLSKTHPLAGSEEVSLEDLRDYPCVVFDQSGETEFYLSEEPFANYPFKKIIRTGDRATSCEMLSLLNGFSIGTGTMTDSLAIKDAYVSIKLKEKDPLTVGYIVKKNHVLSEFGKQLVQEMEEML